MKFERKNKFRKNVIRSIDLSKNLRNRESNLFKSNLKIEAIVLWNPNANVVSEFNLFFYSRTVPRLFQSCINCCYKAPLSVLYIQYCLLTIWTENTDKRIDKVIDTENLHKVVERVDTRSVKIWPGNGCGRTGIKFWVSTSHKKPVSWETWWQLAQKILTRNLNWKSWRSFTLKMSANLDLQSGQLKTQSRKRKEILSGWKKIISKLLIGWMRKTRKLKFIRSYLRIPLVK